MRNLSYCKKRRPVCQDVHGDFFTWRNRFVHEKSLEKPEKSKIKKLWRFRFHL